eukprot:2565078-Lingulodinium_polyedra.AAC.1
MALLASRLFAVADPWTYVASVVGQAEQQASLQLPHAVTQRLQDLSLAQWPVWYEKQYDALVLTPNAKNERSLSDENNPARVRRGGRAQAESGGFPLYPDGEVRPRPRRPQQTQR